MIEAGLYEGRVRVTAAGLTSVFGVIGTSGSVLSWLSWPSDFPEGPLASGFLVEHVEVD